MNVSNDQMQAISATATPITPANLTAAVGKMELLTAPGSPALQGRSLFSAAQVSI